jgi:hemerythrin-like domain-containing protein
MPRAIDELMNEHRVIERVLASLETFGARITGVGEAERRTVSEYVEFFRGFADRCHHGKEEERLFARMVESGMPREVGPIAVMLAEHTIGRAHVGALAAVGDGAGPLDPQERESVRRHAGEYAALLRAHIRKEDGILYPMAIQAVPPSVMDALAQEFAAFERKVTGQAEHERMRALAERLCASYPPDEAAGGGR